MVRPGDTAESIAKEQNAPLSAIADLNQLEYPYRLAEGQALLIPGGSSDRQKPPLWTGGLRLSVYLALGAAADAAPI